MTAPLGAAAPLLSPLAHPIAPMVTLASEQTKNTNPTRTISTIIDYCATHFGLTDTQITGGSRQRILIEPRHVSMYLALLLTGRSSTVIGRKFNRDHTSILYARDRIEDHMSADADFAEGVALLKATILEQTVPNRAVFNE